MSSSRSNRTSTSPEEAETNLRLRPLLKVSPRQRTLSRLYCDLFRDSITETIYDAELAGLKYSIEHRANAIVVKLVGYNDKLLNWQRTC
jgi:secreted Zn-dependent insulinase-like peptidase